MFNLVDTPGHQDFCEDTYRALTAVDAALVLIDSVNGVEKQTIKLMDVCRMRHTPIITFINKMDLDGRHVFDLLDQIENILHIKTAPFTLPPISTHAPRERCDFINWKSRLNIANFYSRTPREVRPGMAAPT